MNMILKLIICLIVGAVFALWVNLEYNRWKPRDEWKPVESQTLKDSLLKENYGEIRILDWRNKKDGI